MGVIEISEPEDPRSGLCLLARFARSRRAPFRLDPRGQEGWRVRRSGEKGDFARVRHPGGRLSGTALNSGPLRTSLMEYGTARATLASACVHQARGKGCGFCNHDKWWRRARRADSREGRFRRDIVSRLVINTATPNLKDKGIGALARATSWVPAGIPLLAGFEAVDDIGLLSRLKENGYRGMFCNLESFDERVRKSVMPGKGATPVKVYEKNWRRGVELFGPGNVTTMIIAGLGESERSVLEGAKRAISAGVNLSLVPLVPVPGAPLEGAPGPSFDLMARLYEGVANAYARLNAVPFRTDIMCLEGDAFTAVKDVWRMGLFR